MTQSDEQFDETKYRVLRALMALAQAGETADPHIKRESYIETLWRLRSIDTDSTPEMDE